MKTYYLKRDKDTIAKFVIESENTFNGKAYQCISQDMNGNPLEWQFHSGAYAKWDGCTHWYFYGEDYPENQDSYYHICSSFQSFITIMCFVWRIAGDYHVQDQQAKGYDTQYTQEEYRLELVDYVLKGYQIQEVEVSNE